MKSVAMINTIGINTDEALASSSTDTCATGEATSSISTIVVWRGGRDFSA